MTNTERLQKAVTFAVQNALVGVLQTGGRETAAYAAEVKGTARDVAKASEMVLRQMALNVYGAE